MSQIELPSPPPRPAGGALKRALLHVLKWALLLGVLFFVGRTLIRLLGDVHWGELRFNAVLVTAAVLCVVISKALPFTFYGLLLGRFGRRPSWPAMAGATWVSQIGKYMPGKVATAVGMALLLQRYGVAGQASVSTIFINDGMSVVLGLAASLPLMFAEPIRGNVPLAWLWCLLLIAAGTVCLHPSVFRRAGNSLLARFGYNQMTLFPRVRDYGPSLAAMVVHFAFLGAGYWLLVRAMTPIPVSLLPMMSCAVVAASIAGFVFMLAPAGLGVQEGVLVIVLKPMLAGPAIAILLVFMRLVQLLAELGLAGAGLLIIRWLPGLAPAPGRPQDAGFGPPSDVDVRGGPSV